MSTDMTWSENQFTGLILVEREKSIARVHGLIDNTFDAIMSYGDKLDTYEVDELSPIEGPWDLVQTEDQAQMNSCGGHGASTGFERACHCKYGSHEQYSRMYAYIVGQRKNNIRGDTGMTIGGGVEMLKEGICRESLLPYTGQYFTTIPQAAIDDAKKHRIGSVTDIIENNHEVMQRFLGLNMGAITAGCRWTQNMANPRNGVIESFGSSRGGGHAWAFVALSPRKDSSGRHYYWLANSHGLRWGNRGFAEVSPDCVSAMWQDNFTEMYGLSEPIVPQANPRVKWKSTWHFNPNHTPA
jgi:hypothetical protein